MPLLPRPLPHRRLILAGALGLVAVLGTGLYLRLSRQVRAAFAETPRATRPLQFAELPDPPFPALQWGGGEVLAVAASPASLTTAGTFGVADETGSLSAGLPSLRATALALWRGHPVAGLATGGLYLRREGRWHQARTSLPSLDVRALLEGPGGELWIGARQGLFCSAWSSASLEQVDAAPVKCLALGPGGVLLAGGEQGLKRIVGRAAGPVPTPDPWVEWVEVQGDDLLVLTPLGLARGPWDGVLAPAPADRTSVRRRGPAPRSSPWPRDACCVSILPGDPPRSGCPRRPCGSSRAPAWCSRTPPRASSAGPPPAGAWPAPVRPPCRRVPAT